MKNAFVCNTLNINEIKMKIFFWHKGKKGKKNAQNKTINARANDLRLQEKEHKKRETRKGQRACVWRVTRVCREDRGGVPQETTDPPGDFAGDGLSRKTNSVFFGLFLSQNE